jgi:hypothetical protein
MRIKFILCVLKVKDTKLRARPRVCEFFIRKLVETKSLFYGNREICKNFFIRIFFDIFIHYIIDITHYAEITESMKNCLNLNIY